MEGHMGFRPGEEGGYGLMDAFPTEQRKEEGNSLSLFLVHLISAVVSLGRKCIDLNLYWKRIKSGREITFSLLKGWRGNFIAGALRVNKYICQQNARV